MITNPFTGQVVNANPKGCNQFSGPECTGYHATRREFDKFESGPHARSGHWFTSSKKKAYSLGDSGDNSPSNRTIKAKLKLGKVIPEGMFKKLVEYYAKLPDSDPVTYDQLYRGEVGYEDSNDLEDAQKQALRSFRKAGYNSAKVKSPTGSTDYAVISPKQIEIIESIRHKRSRS